MRKNVQAQPVPAENPADLAEQMDGETVTLVARKEPVDLPRQPSKARSVGPITEMRDVRTVVDDEVKTRLANRFEAMQRIGQTLAQVADLFDDAANIADEAGPLAADAALALYQARTDGVLTKDETSSILRDKFGARKKGSSTTRVASTDAEASKTPFGKGEDIRKRVERAVDAFEHVRLVNTDVDPANTGSRFFAGLWPSDSDKDNKVSLEGLLSDLDAGERSIWSAYEDFATIKRAHQEKTSLAFDPEKIADIAKALAADGAGEIYRQSKALIAAYKAVTDILDIISLEYVEE